MSVGFYITQKDTLNGQASKSLHYQYFGSVSCVHACNRKAGAPLDPGMLASFHPPTPQTTL